MNYTTRLRERHRKEAEKIEMERMIARYPYECKDLDTYKATDKDCLHFEKLLQKGTMFI